MNTMSSSPAEVPPEPSAEQNVASKTVLLVDDNPTNLNVLFETLAQSELRLLVAEDGEAALDQIQYLKPDIILLDVMMPRMDGFETCRRLKANPDTQGIPVIFMTALHETVSKVEGLSLGGVDYITKPIQPDEVLARVNVHLKLHDLQAQLKEKNQALQQEVQVREQAEHALKLLIRTLSHDLKNPITGVSLVLKNLLQQSSKPSAELSEEASEEALEEKGAIAVPRTVLERMADSAEHQLNLIHSLLDTHILDTHTLDTTATSPSAPPLDQSVVLHYKPVAFHQLVHRVLQELEPLVENHQSPIILQVPSNLPPVYADPDQLRRVLDNLMTNALKHNSPGVVVTVTVEAQDAQLHCTVQDNGQGIPLEEQAQLFQPYHRATAQANTPGLGLGLYLCRQIIQAHGGDIQLSSHPGEGSAFQFTLPLLSSDIAEHPE